MRPSCTDCFRGRRVVVTGGAGFIGSHLTDALASVADKVIVIDDLSTGSLGNLSSALFLPIVEFTRGTVLNMECLHGILLEGDVVFHLAAIPSITRSLQDPLASDLANAHGTLSVLKAASDAGAAHVVFASSSSVYGDSPVLPRVETAVPRPMSPYAVSKLAGEHYCDVFTRQYGLLTSVVRFFNVYGPRQIPHSQYSAVIPLFIDAALHSSPLTVYGDGEQTRDFTFVEDVVQASLTVATRRAEGIFNVATGRTISIRILAQQILRLTASSSSILHLPERSGDVRDSAADISRLNSLGHGPQYELRRGLEETIQWARAHQQEVGEAESEKAP